MIPEKKKELLEALRGEGFRQGYSALTTVTPEGEFDCCLGVVCKISKLPLDISKTEEFIGRYQERVKATVKQYNGNTLTLPYCVKEEFGFDSEGPDFSLPSKLRTRSTPETPSGDSSLSLAGLNDDGFSHKQIADIVEYFF